MSAIRALTNIFLKPNFRICAFSISNNLKSGELFRLWGPSTTVIRTYAKEEDKKREKGNLFIVEDNPTYRPSTSTFEEVLESKTFVDKSALILAVFETNEKPMVLCTAPSRFGKTANLWMMQRFLEMEVDENGKERTKVLEEKYNYKLFSSARLKVMQNKEFVKTHFGKYPIININFLCTYNVKSASDAVDVCRRAIRDAFRQYSYLYESKLSPLENDEKNVCEQWCDESTYEGIPDEDVLKGLATLAVYLNKFHKKQVFLLVDEYGSITSNALYDLENADPEAELEELKKVVSFPIRVIGHALKLSSDIFKGAYITGILDVGGVAISTLWGSNVLRCQFGTNNLCRDFNGFTEEEVCTLFNRFEVKEELRRKAEAKYNGYFNGSKKRLYNPQTIVRFLGNLSRVENALKNYWPPSGYIHNMYKLFHKDSVRMLFGKLLQGVPHFAITLKPLESSDLQSLRNILINGNLTCDVEIVVRFLVSVGFLTYSCDDQKLQIPNSDLIDAFIESLKHYFFDFFKRYGINTQLANTCSESFSELNILCDEGDSSTKFKEELANFQNTLTCLLQRLTLIDPLNEATLQSIITLACNQTGFFSDNEIRIVNYGTKVDVVLYNYKSGIKMELKCDPYTVEDAFKQVFKNYYCNVLPTKKYLNASQNDAPLSLVMGIHVDSEKKASVMCLQSKDIIAVLDDLKIDAEPLLENRIKMAVICMGERFINICCERATVS